MIVVEGPDGSGKSTLCQHLHEKYGFSHGERSIANRDEIYKSTRIDTWNAMHDELMCYPLPRVWDRMGPYSDPVYSNLGIPHDRECAFTDMEIAVFEEFMRFCGLVILCLPQLEVVRANVNRNHQLDGVATKTDDIYYSYKNTMFHHLRYNYTLPTALARIEARVEKYLELRKERLAKCSSSSTPATSPSDASPQAV